MAYTVSEIAEFIEYQLVVAARNDDAASSNLFDLVDSSEGLAPRQLSHEVSWAFCDRCGCSVDTDLIRQYDHHHAEDGDFCCADCGYRPSPDEAEGHMSV